jgi:PAS domain S-box-containing protein
MGRVAETSEPLVIEDYQEWAGRVPQYADIHAVMTVPLEVAGRLVGVISIGAKDRDRRYDDTDLHLLSLFAQQAAIAISNARLLGTERQRADELDALRTTMAEITAELELSTLLQAIVQRASVLLNSKGGELALYDEASQQVRVVVSQGLGEDYVGARHKLGEGAMGRSAQTRESLIIEDYATWDGRAPQYADPKFHAAMAAPLEVRNRLVGVIDVIDTDPDRRFTSADLHLLNLFARQAAIAIENARLFSETERQVAELATLTDVGKALSSTLRVDEVLQLIHEQTRRVMYAENMIIVLYDEGHHELEFALSTNPDDVRVGERAPGDAGFSGYVIKHRESLLLRSDVMEGREELGVELLGAPSESWLGVPMLRGERVLGVIVVQHYTEPDVYDESHQVLLETIASQAAVAIDNARLYDQAQREIAERKRAEDELRQYQEHLEELVLERTSELRQSEERYRSLFDRVPVGLYRTTPEGQIVDANPALAQILGHGSRENLLTADAGGFYASLEDRERWQLLLQREGLVRDFEVRFRRPDGSVIWVNDTARAVTDEQGKVLYYEGSMEDITERKKAEEELHKYQEHLEELVEARTAELRESEERYRTLFDGVPVGLYRTTPSGQILDMNAAVVQMFGAENRDEVPTEVTEANIYVDPEERARWQALMEHEGVVRDFEAAVRRLDGSVMWMSDTARAVRDEEGQVLYYEGSLEDITERKRAEEELRQAKEEAEAANQAKSSFLANMSHELRTPLNAIIGFTRLVKRRSGELLPHKQLDNLDKVLVSADHLLGLINDVLDLSKIEAGRTDVRPATFNLEPLIDACLQTVRPLVKSEELRLVKEIGPDLPMLFTDQDKVRQILINLVCNAVKFTEKGSVTVSVQRQGEAVVLAVADTGIGIPDDALESIFKAFQQVDSSTTRRYGGTGLGLSISLQLARLLGGDIKVESKVGVGSTFTVTLPVCYVVAPRTVVTAPVPEPQSEVMTVETGGGPVVLAIDDDSNVIYLLQENLTEAGYQVVGATSGEEGLQKARELEPFVIILDILMSPKDGWQILRELKADAATQDIPVVVLSIVDNQEMGYRLGACDYLVKPFDRGAILGTLARIAPRPAESERVDLLVVDDDPQVVDLVRQLLEDDPYVVRSASDGEEALRVIYQRCPDVILLDLLMPQLDGFGVIERLQESAEHCHTPVIVLTAKELTPEELTQLRKKVSSVMRKQGLDRDTLLQSLRTTLQAYRTATEAKG